MSADRFVLAASHAGRTVNIWRFVRAHAAFFEWSCEFPGYHRTSRDGEHPHFTAPEGLHTAPVHPLVIGGVREATGLAKPKHHPGGWPTRWRDVEDYVATSGMGFVYPGDFDRFDPDPPCDGGGGVSSSR